MILLINPRATRWRYRIPLSLLSIGAALEGAYPYQIVDGNIVGNIQDLVLRLIREKSIRYVGITVMPGPQLGEAIVLSRAIRGRFPRVTIIWGGYFPTLHTGVVLNSTYVDYVIRDQGDYSFRQLVDVLEHGGALSSIKGLSHRNGGIHHNEKQELIDPGTLPDLPYHRIDVPRYIGRTYIGTRTINYHSSVGCPFLCGFCAVAAVYKARWIGLDAARIVKDLEWFRQTYDVNAVEFHDNNFFTSEKRSAEFAERMLGKKMTWWGEGRPDTLLKYDDSTWRTMAAAGAKMIFFGAESSSQKVLDLMDKGGTQTPDTVLTLAEKMRRFGIVPEFSFVLGSPTDTVDADIDQDIAYIKTIKRINPASEIIIYVYSPVHFEEATLYHAAQAHQFAYPQNLDDWLLPQWQLHDLRKNPVTPWLTPRAVKKIRNFEKVLNAAFPTNSDLKLRPWQRRTLRAIGRWRYALGAWGIPYEVAGTQRIFRYRQPEIEGF